MYEVVGVIGAGTVVGWIEGHVFDEHLTPWVRGLVDATVPGEALRSLVTGANGLWTLAVTYAVAIVVPVVGLFFRSVAITAATDLIGRLGHPVEAVGPPAPGAGPPATGG